MAILAMRSSNEILITMLPLFSRDVANQLCEADYQECIETVQNAPDSKISFSNLGKLIKNSVLFESLNGIREEQLLEKIPLGNKTNKTYFVKRSKLSPGSGPGSMCDDKHPYNGTYGSSVFAYVVQKETFQRATPSYVSTSGSGFTYKDKGEVTDCKEDWIIIWRYHCSRKVNDSKLTRFTTYFETKNPEFIWLNQIALAEYIGEDGDEASNIKLHGNALKNEGPFRKMMPGVLKKVGEMTEAGVKPKDIYKQMRNTNEPSLGLRNAKQIYNVANKQKLAKFGPSFGSSGSDQALKVFNDMQFDKENYGLFVKHFYVDHLGKPAIICFNNWQIEYTKVQCRYNTFRCSPIVEDKSYNMSCTYVTHYCFQTRDFVLRSDPTVHPIVPGNALYLVALFKHELMLHVLGDSWEKLWSQYLQS